MYTPWLCICTCGTNDMLPVGASWRAKWQHSNAIVHQFARTGRSFAASTGTNTQAHVAALSTRSEVWSLKSGVLPRWCTQYRSLVCVRQVVARNIAVCVQNCPCMKKRSSKRGGRFSRWWLRPGFNVHAKGSARFLTSCVIWESAERVNRKNSPSKYPAELERFFNHLLVRFRFGKVEQDVSQAVP